MIESNDDDDGVFMEMLLVKGLRSQMLKTIEEFAEAQQAIVKYLLAEKSVDYIDNVVDELADAQIMLDQMAVAFGTDFDYAYDTKFQKLKAYIESQK